MTEKPDSAADARPAAPPDPLAAAEAFIRRRHDGSDDNDEHGVAWYPFKDCPDPICRLYHAAALAGRPAVPPDFDYVTLLGEAQAEVRSSVLWKRFIDGTPLSNDIAVWMANFVMKYLKQPRNAFGDAACEHGTALDVHCCNCHSGFIFDKGHECPPAALAAPAVPPACPLTDDDIDQIIDGLDNFCIGPVEDSDLRAIWQPFIDKLMALKQAPRSRAD